MKQTKYQVTDNLPLPAFGLQGLPNRLIILFHTKRFFLFQGKKYIQHPVQILLQQIGRLGLADKIILENQESYLLGFGYILNLRNYARRKDNNSWGFYMESL